MPLLLLLLVNFCTVLQSLIGWMGSLALVKHNAAHRTQHRHGTAGVRPHDLSQPNRPGQSGQSALSGHIADDVIVKESGFWCVKESVREKRQVQKKMSFVQYTVRCVLLYYNTVIQCNPKWLK